MRFISTTIIGRCETEKKLSIDDGEFVVHVQIHNTKVQNGQKKDIAVVIISDKFYPKEVAHRIINKLFLLHGEKITKKQLEEILESYQNPEFDPVYKVRKELAETKDILCQTLEKILERGEKLDDLVDKTLFLSENSKSFYRAAKKQNRYCPLWFPFPI